jgi:hypothetical protein
MPVKAVARFIQRSGKRIAVTNAGFAVLLAVSRSWCCQGRDGCRSSYRPQTILATQYGVGERLLTAAKRKAEQAKDVVLRKKKSDDTTCG